MELTFREIFEYTISLSSFEEELYEYLDYEYDDTIVKSILKYLFENSTNEALIIQKDAWNLMGEEGTLGSVVASFLEKIVYPKLPDYTDEQLTATDFSQDVTIEFQLDTVVDLSPDARYTDNGSGFWQQHSFDDDEEERFLEYVKEYVEENTDTLLDGWWFDNLTENRDLSIDRCSVADITQWKCLEDLYYEFSQESNSSTE